MTAAVQAPDNPSILNKRSLYEIENMNVDENSSCKKIKTHSHDDQVSGEIVSEYSKKIVLFPKKSVQMHQFSFRGEGSAELSSGFKSRAEFMSSYAEKKIQSSEETKILLPRVRSLVNQNTSLISTQDVERNTLKFAMVSDKKYLRWK